MSELPLLSLARFSHGDLLGSDPRVGLSRSPFGQLILWE